MKNLKCGSLQVRVTAFLCFGDCINYSLVFKHLDHVKCVLILLSHAMAHTLSKFKLVIDWKECKSCGINP